MYAVDAKHIMQLGLVSCVRPLIYFRDHMKSIEIKS